MDEEFTITGASEALRRDRRGIQVALRDVVPDGTPDVRGRPRWKISTISSVMVRYDRATRHGSIGPGSRSGGHDTSPDRICADLEQVALRLDRAMRRMDQETDTARKAAMAVEAGALVGELDRVLARSLDHLDAPQRAFAQLGIDGIMRKAIGHFVVAAGYEGIDFNQ